MGSSLSTLVLSFKLQEIDNDYKKNVALEYPTIPIGVTELEQNISSCTTGDFRSLLNEEFSDGQLTKCLQISIMSGNRSAFDQLLEVYIRRFNEMVAANTKKPEDNKDQDPQDKKAVLDLLSDLSHTQISLRLDTSKIIPCCAYVSDSYYFEKLYTGLVNQFGMISSIAAFWHSMAICGSRGNLDTLNFLDGTGNITQRLMLRIAYGAISGDQKDVLVWALSHEKHGVPVMDCLLNAAVYLDRVDMFRDMYRKLAQRNYEVPSDLLDTVISEKRTDMFSTVLNMNIFSKKDSEKVLDLCADLMMFDKMVDVICASSKDGPVHKPIHIKTIYQHPEQFNRLITTYPQNLIPNVFAVVIDNENIDDVLMKIQERSPGELSVKDTLMLVSHSRDVDLVRAVLKRVEMLIEDQDAVVSALTQDSNDVLYQVLSSDYKFVASSDTICSVVRRCTGVLVLNVLKDAQMYEPEKVIQSILSHVDGHSVDSITQMLDDVLLKYPRVKVDRYALWGLSICKDTAIVDAVLSKIPSLRSPHVLLSMIKYSSSDEVFYHILNNYLSNEPDLFKEEMAKEYSYSVESMIKGKGFDRLVYLVKNLNVPLEFSVLQYIGKMFEVSRISLFSDNTKELEKNGVSAEQLIDLLKCCTKRACTEISGRFDPTQKKKKISIF